MYMEVYKTKNSKYFLQKKNREDSLFLLNLGLIKKFCIQ